MKPKRDRHHVLHTRQEWKLRPESDSIRQTPQLIPLIDRDLHDELHRKAPAVPLLSYYVLKKTIVEFEPQESTVETIDNLMLSINRAANTSKAHPLERALAELSIEALELQRGILIGNVYELVKR